MTAPAFDLDAFGREVDLHLDHLLDAEAYDAIEAAGVSILVQEADAPVFERPIPRAIASSVAAAAVIGLLFVVWRTSPELQSLWGEATVSSAVIVMLLVTAVIVMLGVNYALRARSRARVAEWQRREQEDLDAARSRRRRRREKLEGPAAAAIAALQQEVTVKAQICAMLRSAGDDVKELAKQMVPAVAALILAGKADSVPLSASVVAYTTLLVARMGVAGFCAGVPEPKK